ncbi:DUF6801 domain-containing protein [Amycolatopsis solani]|uniref:DUF6801 domain-containing protein n=1 Tax=Amycolatopsis solani TaxID=3028615 RepID=UPI0025B22ACD|nr:DUF6801 domain-containing protein [Amycolatopsis sp. MEP2-6]
MVTRFAPAAVLALTATALLAGPAHASTAYHSGPIGYTCTTPGSPALAVTLLAGFTGPDTVAPGAAFAISEVSGSVTLSPAARAYFTAGGNDGVLGGFTAAFIEAANAPRSSTTSAPNVPALWGPDPVAIDFHNGKQTHRAGASGTVTFRADRLAVALSLHRPDGAPAGPALVCTQVAGQDASFTPALPIT